MKILFYLTILTLTTYSSFGQSHELSLAPFGRVLASAPIENFGLAVCYKKNGGYYVEVVNPELESISNTKFKAYFRNESALSMYANEKEVLLVVSHSELVHQLTMVDINGGVIGRMKLKGELIDVCPNPKGGFFYQMYAGKKIMKRGPFKMGYLNSDMQIGWEKGTSSSEILPLNATSLTFDLYSRTMYGYSKPANSFGRHGLLMYAPLVSRGYSLKQHRMDGNRVQAIDTSGEIVFEIDYKNTGKVVQGMKAFEDYFVVFGIKGGASAKAETSHWICTYDYDGDELEEGEFAEPVRSTELEQEEKPFKTIGVTETDEGIALAGRFARTFYVFYFSKDLEEIDQTMVRTYLDKDDENYRRVPSALANESLAVLRETSERHISFFTTNRDKDKVYFGLARQWASDWSQAKYIDILPAKREAYNFYAEELKGKEKMDPLRADFAEVYSIKKGQMILVYKKGPIGKLYFKRFDFP